MTIENTIRRSPQSAPTSEVYGRIVGALIAGVLALLISVALSSVIAWGVLEAVADLDVTFDQALAVGILLWLSNILGPKAWRLDRGA